MLSASLLLAPCALFGQGTTATLNGTVTDASGAVIPNADVTLINQASGDKRLGKSNGAGDFSFSAVPVGDYEVDVKSAGFQQLKQGGIHLDPGDQRSLRELKLAAGSDATQVNVQEATQSITLDSGEQSSLISAQDIAHLSVEGRDVTELLKILPGFAITGQSGNGQLNGSYDPSQVSVTGSLGSYAGAGNNINGTSLLSDGTDITDPGNFGSAIQNINYEQVAEVKVQTASFTADEARGPIVINAVGKSGGDHFHGSLYTYGRTNQIDSADWLANYTGTAKPPDRQVYPGFTLGGPIYVPHVDFNKNKRLTFFVGAEDYAQRSAYAYGSAGSAILSALVPTAAMRTGDFSQGQIMQYLGNEYTNSAYANLQAVPVTGKAGGPLAGGNIASQLDPTTTALVNTLPLPNITSNNGYNYTTTNLIDNNLWQARGRVDYAINDKNKLFAVYSKEAGKNGVPQVEYYSPRGNLGGVNVPGGGLLSTINSEIGSLNYTSIISPTTTNELYVAGSWLIQNFVPKNFGATTLNGAYNYGGLFNNGSKVIPEFQDYGNDGLPLSLLPDATYGGIYAKKWVRTGGDNLTRTIGKHTFRIGVFGQLDTNHEVTPFVNTNGAIQLYYFPETIADPVAGTVHYTGAVGSGNGGNYLANFMEGGVESYNQTNIQAIANLYFWNIDGYAQDHWRITPHLTVDYGVRFDHLGPWNDAHGQGIPVWNAAAYASRSNPLLPGIEWHAVDPSVPLSGVPSKWAYTEPRVGFAWDAIGNGQTVVRGGFGIYRAHDSYNDVTQGISTVLGQRTATANNLLLSSVASQAATATNASGFVPSTSASALLAGDDQVPQVFTYNVAVDQKTIFNSFFEIAYIGNRQEHLFNNGSSNTVELNNINALPIGALFRPNPVTGVTLPLLPGTGTLNSTNTANSVTNLSSNEIDQYRPYPLYHTLSVSQHNAYANYNSLQTQWNKQQGKLSYGVNYTFSKVLGVEGGGPSGEGNGLPVDPFNYRDSYGPLSFDRTHIFNATYSYDFGKLVKSKLIGIAANGWLLTGITNIQSGGDAAAQVNPDFGLTGNLAVTNQTGQPATLGVNATNFLGTPDVLLQPNLTCDPGIHTQSKQYINSACFSLPQIGQQGVTRMPYIHMPAFTDTDLTAAKDFAVREGSDIQFRFAAFNFINHANTTFATSVQPNALILNYNNGSSSAANAVPVASAIANAPQVNTFGSAPLRTGRRIVEMSLKYSF
ncbi:carboxypeptidase-like regulatory domain-containing protein [Acidipila sp. EB88]|uniref:carboxypeptidase-like regulatory domain-containing protein n=1 Tax=Acidipila sp. EB88 TaxID=2305226 RepID=UPI0013156AD2|nr:carboxypeptidase-like regulatory domain-containing protein [Acidipila sp. EB88]